ncbi:hypothetical protein CDL15_Pgr009162 [Punica granatum]|uniref:Uncharacterized protein n=1 Tax=Punica granatum TaxID=22663 RepID=A0A218WIS1_PUNGR|nr:hypothetical protein CDL15_Pgr009162 [Punica granatum]
MVKRKLWHAACRMTKGLLDNRIVCSRKGLYLSKICLVIGATASLRMPRSCDEELELWGGVPTYPKGLGIIVCRSSCVCCTYDPGIIRDGIYRGPATFSSVVASATAGATVGASTSDANLEEEQGPWQHFPYADDLANMQVTPLGAIAFRPLPVKPSMMPHPRAPITKETIEGASARTAQRGRRDGFDVTKDQTDVTDDRIDVTREKFDVPRDEFDVTRDEFDVTKDEFDVTRDEIDETMDELNVTRDEFDVTSDEFNMTRDEFDVTFFSGTQMMQLA